MSGRRRVLLLSDSYTPHDRGGSDRIAELNAQGLRERGWDVTVFTSFPTGGSPAVAEESGIRVVRAFPLHFGPLERSATLDHLAEMSLELWNPWMQRALEGAIADFRPDLLHAHYIPRVSFGAFTRAGAGVPCVMTFHSYHYECPKGGLFRRRGVICTEKPLPCRGFRSIMTRTLEGVDRVIAISRFIERGLLESGVSRERIVWLPNGVPLPADEAAPASASRLVLFVGRLEPNKGADVLVRAFRALDAPDVRLRIVGDGSQMPHLRELAGDDSRIEFTGWLRRDEVARSYRECRFVVLPSVYHEGMNTVACEAAAVRRPVIVTNLGGNPDLVDPDVSGYVIEAGDPGVLTDRMRRLLNDDALTDSFGAAARRHIEAFSLERHLEAVERLYAELLRPSSAGAR